MHDAGKGCFSALCIRSDLSYQKICATDYFHSASKRRVGVVAANARMGLSFIQTADRREKQRGDKAIMM